MYVVHNIRTLALTDSTLASLAMMGALIMSGTRPRPMCFTCEGGSGGSYSAVISGGMYDNELWFIEYLATIAARTNKIKV